MGTSPAGETPSALSVPERPARWLWRDGALVPWAEATVHVNAVGHASVSAVFEGIKAYRGHDGTVLYAFRLDEHMARLAQSVRLARLAMRWSAQDLAAACLQLLEANEASGDTYLRPWVFPRGIIHEQMVPEGADCEVVVDSWSFRSALGSGKPCKAMVSSWQRIDDASTPPRIKAFSNYHNGRLALLEARRSGCDWPILLNRAGRVCEGPGSCLAVVRNGVVATPPVSSGTLDGITRQTIIALCSDLDVPVEVRDIDRAELYIADEVFFLGTAWEVLPVGVVDGLSVGSGEPGPVSSALARAYDDLVRGRTDPRHTWLTTVSTVRRDDG